MEFFIKYHNESTSQAMGEERLSRYECKSSSSALELSKKTRFVGVTVRVTCEIEIRVSKLVPIRQNWI